MFDAQRRARLAAPRRGQRDELADVRKLLAVIEEEAAHDEPAHAVRDDVQALEAVTQLQVRQLPVQQVRHRFERCAGRILEKPRLIARAIETFEERTLVDLFPSRVWAAWNPVPSCRFRPESNVFNKNRRPHRTDRRNGITSAIGVIR